MRIFEKWVNEVKGDKLANLEGGKLGQKGGLSEK